MRNISKKTRKKINKILLSNHFKKKLGVTQDTLVYTPNPESPLSAIWHHIEVRYDGTIFGYLLDDKVKKMEQERWRTEDANKTAATYFKWLGIVIVILVIAYIICMGLGIA